MKHTSYLYKAYVGMLSVSMAGVMAGCQPDEIDSNALTVVPPVPTFTVTAVADKINTYTLKAGSTEGTLATRWDLGDGGGPIAAAPQYNAFFPDAGTYNVTLMAIGAGGGTVVSAPQTIVIDKSDPNAGNLVVGGKMEAGDESKWTALNITPGVAFTFADGKVAAKGGPGHAAIYQAIDVVAGKKYKVDMNVSGSGATNTWFEVYLGKAAPTPNADYSSDGIRLALNTWAGCGNAAFGGKLSAVACEGAAKGTGVVTFAQSGTVYLVIKTGGDNLGTTGIVIDNVELRGVQ